MGRRTGTFACLVLGLILVTWPQNATAGRFEDLIAQAAEARDAGDSEATLAFLEEAYRLRSLPTVLNNIGRTLELLGRYQEAARAYQGVIDHPNAKRALVALNERRLQAVRKRLGRAWLMVEARPPQVSVHLDGERLKSGDERTVSEGNHLIQLTRVAEPVLALLIFVEGRKSFLTNVTRDLNGAVPENSVIEVEGMPGPVQEISINGFPIQMDWKMNRIQLRLASGTYDLQIKFIGGSVQSRQVQIEPGQTLLLTKLVVRPPAAPVAPKKKVRLEIVESRLPGPWPWFLVGAGATGVGVGAVLLGLAEADRNRVRGAARRDDGVVTGLTMLGALRLQDRANRRWQAGWATLGIGMGMTALGIIWWLIISSDEPAPASPVAIQF